VGPPIFDDTDTRASGPRRSRSPDSQRQARIPSTESTLRRLHQCTSAVVCPIAIFLVFYEELRLALCLTPGKQTQRRGTLPRRNKRHDDVLNLHSSVLEVFELCPLAQIPPPTGAPLIPVDCIPDDSRCRGASRNHGRLPQLAICVI